MSRLGDRSEVPGLDRACGWKTIWGSPGLKIDVVSGIELGYSYGLGSGQTRIGVLTRPRKRLAMVMTLWCSVDYQKCVVSIKKCCVVFVL